MALKTQHGTKKRPEQTPWQRSRHQAIPVAIAQRQSRDLLRARARLQAGIPAFEILREAGLAASNSEARRLIKAGGARINDVPVSGEMQPVGLADMGEGNVIKLSAGKKRHAIVKPV